MSGLERMSSIAVEETARARDGEARARRNLAALNFFMADMQAGIGPFLGVFLQQRGWSAGPIGTIISVGGIAGLLATAPAGAIVDRSNDKRVLIAVTGVATVASSLILLFSQTGLAVTASQIAHALAGAAIGPAVTGMTLGIARQAGFNALNGRNQAWNHAGNLVGAALSGWLGWLYGMAAVFWLSALFGLFAIIAALRIPARLIDNRAARGLSEGHQGGAPGEGMLSLLSNRPLLILAAALACFHLGNGAMLPLYGMAVVGAGHAEAASFTALTIVVAQGVMIAASLIAMRMASRRGYWLVLLISFAALPLRGLLAGGVIAPWGVWPVQALDGIGAGLQSVAVPGLVACLLEGTGSINLGQGTVMMVQGLGASLSPLIGGWMAQEIGYRPTFMILGGFAVLSLALWIGFAGRLRPLCGGVPR